MTYPGTSPDGGAPAPALPPPLPADPEMLRAGGEAPGLIVPPAVRAGSAGQDDLLGLRIAAALIDLVLLGGLFVIVACIAGRVSAGGRGLSAWLSPAWAAAFAAVVMSYYLALEACSGQAVGKRMLGVQVHGPGRARPSAWMGCALLRLVGLLPLTSLASFITVLATGSRRQPIGDLSTRTAVARAAPARHRALAAVPLAAVVLTAAGLAGNAGPGVKVVPAPAGFALSQASDVHNGPMNATRFNQYMGTPNLAASLHFVRGYDVTYDSTTSRDSIEVTLFQFATPDDAASFEAGFIPGVPARSRTDPVIPASEDYDSTAPYQGTYDHVNVAAKGNWAFVIDYLTGSAVPVPLVQKMARQQYAALPAPGRTSVQAGGERITSYAAWITIQRDGSILVTEKITYDFGHHWRHGIFRVIPVRLRYNGSYDRLYPLAVRSVRSPDAPSQYTVQDNGSSVRIRIGDPDRTITGQHTYKLTYLLRGSLTAVPGGSKLSWNAVGTQWDVPIYRADVWVSAPVAVTGAACFAGPFGSARSCQRAGINEGIAHFGQARLGPHQGLTVVVAIPKGTVASAGPILRERWSWQRAFAVTPVSGGAAGGLLAVLAATAAVVLARRRHPGRHSRPAAEVTGGRAGQAGEAALAFGHGQPPIESAPPADLRPGQADTLLNLVATRRGITATIVDLAVRGYLRIQEVPPHVKAMRAIPDWRLVRLDKTGGLLEYEQILLDGLFEDATATRSGAPATRLSELGPAFARRLKHAEGALYADVADRGWFTARPDRVRGQWLAIGAAMFVAGMVAMMVAAAGSHHLGLAPVPIALAGLVLIGGARWMPVRTAEGTALARQVEGFRRFIETNAATRARPAGQPGTLYDYLPYAIAFGCTEQWAALTAALAGTKRAPSWYRSSGPFSPHNFCSLPRLAYYFSTFHHCAATTSSWAASHAASTGGSGFGGGFSGGGFSGGGDGGGGGGSW